MSAGRQSDIDYLLSIIKNPNKSSGERRMAEENLKKITNESGLIKSMRERLIKETRAGRTANVRDISEWVAKRSRYRND